MFLRTVQSLYPAYPPDVRLVWPRLDNQMVARLMFLDELAVASWSPLAFLPLSSSLLLTRSCFEALKCRFFPICLILASVCFRSLLRGIPDILKAMYRLFEQFGSLDPVRLFFRLLAFSYKLN